MIENELILQGIRSRKISKSEVQAVAEEVGIKFSKKLPKDKLIDEIISQGFENRLCEVFSSRVIESKPKEIQGNTDEIQALEKHIATLETYIKQLESEKADLIKQLEEQAHDLIVFNNWKKNVKKGGRKKMFTKAEKEVIKSEYMRGTSIRGLAKKYKCSSTLIHNILHDKC